MVDDKGFLTCLVVVNLWSLLWFLLSPVYQQPWYRLSLLSTRKDSNYQRHLWVEEWKTIFSCFLKKAALMDFHILYFFSMLAPWGCLHIKVPSYQDFFFSRSQTLGGCLNIKMPSYQYRDSHYKGKAVWWPSYLYDGNPCTRKVTLYIEMGPRMLPTVPMRQYLCVW